MPEEPKIDKRKFDAILDKLIKAKPLPKKQVQASRKRKLHKVIPAK